MPPIYPITDTDALGKRLAHIEDEQRDNYGFDDEDDIIGCVDINDELD